MFGWRFSNLYRTRLLKALKRPNAQGFITLKCFRFFGFTWFQAAFPHFNAKRSGFAFFRLPLPSIASINAIARLSWRRRSRVLFFRSFAFLFVLLPVPSFICSFASLSLAYRTVSGPNGFCLFLSPLLFDTFKFYPQILAFVMRFSLFRLLFLDHGNDCNTLTGQ